MVPNARETASVSASLLASLAHMLGEAEHVVTWKLSRVLEQDGCTVEQWRALVLLSDGVSHSMSEIAEFALVPAPTLTRLIDRMVADNLAYRTPDPHDRRRVLVHLTRRGRGFYERVTRRVEREQDEILAEVEIDELAQLATLLDNLINRLR